MDVVQNYAVKAGDWVESYSPGIWRVFRIINGFYELRFRITERRKKSKRIVFINKRLVDENWQQAFIAESSGVVQALDERDRFKLAEYLASHPGVLDEFDAYTPENFNFTMELRFNIVDAAHRARFQDAMARRFSDIATVGVTNSEVLDRIADTPFASFQATGISNIAMRFHCHNHELREGEFAFRSMRVV